MNQMTLRRQMVVLIAVPTLVIYIVILGLTTLYAFAESKASIQRDMTQLANHYAARFDSQLREAAQIAEIRASSISTVGVLPDENKYYELLERGIERTHLVYGACLAFEPGVVRPPNVLFAPYVCRDGEGFRRLNIDQSVYDWYRDPKYTWFTRPKSVGHGVWSEPYFDEGAGNILMTTYSAPFKINGQFAGVATVDVDLPELHKTVQNDFSQDLRFFILSTDGRFVSDLDKSRIMAKSIFDVAAEKQRPDLAALGRRMLEGTSGVASIDGWDSTLRQWVFFAPIRSTKWVFACRLPENRVLADVRRQLLLMGSGLTLALLLIVGCILHVSKVVAAPISLMKEKVAQFGQGQLNVRVDETARTDEVRHLAQSFNKMSADLRAHVDRLASEQAARARVEQDLALAREIQQSLLPAADPATVHLDIAGRSHYCDATGGDYYDFINLSQPHTGTTLIAVGDVTGHGIASALLMASARAALRVQAANAGLLSMLLTRVNELLAADNRHNRFMTMALLEIDPAGGVVRWASAGHDPVIVFHPDDGSYEELEGGGLPLGIVADEAYEEYESRSLRAGDVLILGTDGIWEMRNPAGDMFGKDRLRDVMREFQGATSQHMARVIEQRLDAFRGSASQLDDVTFVIVRLKESFQPALAAAGAGQVS